MKSTIFDGEQEEMIIDLKNSSQDQVSIIIVHNNALDYLNICLQSISVCSVNNNIEIIVVDNGSDKQTQDFLSEIQDEVKVIRNEKNLYWAAAANKGAEAADKHSKYLIFMHHDVVVENPGWIDLMINAAESQNSGMVGLQLGSFKMEDQRIDYIKEWCLLFTRECWNKIGPFPTELPQLGGSFIMTRKAQLAKYNPQSLKNKICHHYGIFRLNINEWERIQEESYVMMPKLLRKLYSDNV